jgi:putative transposase
MGLILVVVIHAPSIQDCDGAKLVFDKICNLFPKLHLFWADAGYAGLLIDWRRHFIGCGLEIIKRCDHKAGFRVLPRGWVVERNEGMVGSLSSLN